MYLKTAAHHVARPWFGRTGPGTDRAKGDLQNARKNAFCTKAWKYLFGHCCSGRESLWPESPTCPEIRHQPADNMTIGHCGPGIAYCGVANGDFFAVVRPPLLTSFTERKAR
jgi:hypothetical protein